MNMQISSLQLTGGYWFELNDLQASVHVYQLLTGQEKKDLGADPITENTRFGSIHNPYIHISGTFNKWSWQAGIQYFYHADADTKNYRTSGDSLVRAPDLDMTGISHSALLPSAGINYNINSKLQIRAAYSKNYMRSYMYGPIKSLYTRNQDAFEQAGMKLEDIFKDWELETSDQFDLGIHYGNGNYTLEITPFYAFHHHVLTPVYDPEVEIQYYQNVGEVHAKGIEWKSFFRCFQSLSVYFNTTYSHMSYQENIEVQSQQTTQTRNIKSNQIPALPLLHIKSGISYDYKAFTLTSKFGYTGKRYGDATNEQNIKGHTLVDMQLAYNPEFSWCKNVGIMIEIKNLLNTSYISRIQSWDYSKSGDASYFAGAPRACIVTVKADF
jgi:iron complex outermembrane receptor protein